MEETRDLQAASSLISIFEKAKSHLDSLFDDEISGILAVIDKNGKIYRGNHELAKIQNCDIEDLIHKNIFQILSEEDQNNLKNQFEEILINDRLIPNLEFSIYSGGENRRYSCKLNKIRSITWDAKFVIFGTDITHVVELMNKNRFLIDTNQMLSTMLNSLNQGIFVFDRAGNCSNFVSKACVDILGFDPANRDIRQVIGILPSKVDVFNEWMELIFGSPNLVYKLLPLAPKKVQGLVDKEVFLEFKPIFASDRNLSYLLVIATDRTSEFKALKKMKESTDFANMVTKIFKSREDFVIGLNSIELIFNQLVKILEIEKLSTAEWDIIKFNIHSIKGNAGFLSMMKLHDEAHYFESKMAEDDFVTNYPDWRQTLFAPLTEIFSKYKNEAKQFLGFGENESLEVKREYSYQYIKERYEILKNKDSAGLTASEIFYRDFVCVSAEQLVKPFDNLLDQLSKKLSKKISPIKIINPNDVRIDPQEFNEVFIEMVHLFRNIADHGIETPERRSELGKPESGSVVFVIEEETIKQVRYVKFRIQDDGGGINTSKVKDSLIKKGVNCETWNENQIMMGIFQSGISTAEAITDISGRGVGLSALYQAVKKIDGYIDVQSQQGLGTIFTLHLPHRK